MLFPDHLTPITSLLYIFPFLKLNYLALVTYRIIRQIPLPFLWQSCRRNLDQILVSEIDELQRLTVLHIFNEGNSCLEVVPLLSSDP